MNTERPQLPDSVDADNVCKSQDGDKTTDQDTESETSLVRDSDSDSQDVDSGRMDFDSVVTDAFILRYLPKGYDPMPERVQYLKACVVAGPKAKRSEIARMAKLNEHTVRGWFHRDDRMALWMHRILLAMIGVKGVPKAWEAMKVLAEKGDKRAAHMLFLRFDGQYRAALHKQPVEDSPEETEPVSEELAEEARKINERAEQQGAE